MGISGGYIFRETGGNLRRNLLMTVAAIITMMLSLTALAGALLMKQAVAKQSMRWQHGVELAIFLNPGVTDSQRAAVGKELAGLQDVRQVKFVDKPQAYDEFRVMFGNTPDLVNSLSVNDMPPSYRVVPTKAQDVEAIGARFQSQPGVRDVVYAKAVISSIMRTFRIWQRIAYVLAACALLGAIALIVNTIQLAIFARRREIAVMKLVGATNWFIQIPFMVEGMVEGVLGGLAAFGISFIFRGTIASLASSGTGVAGPPLYVTSQEAIFTGIVILVVGALIGVVGSAFAVRRFLRV
jgi:cell division transport system permease protein